MAEPFSTVGIVGSGAVGIYFGTRLGAAGASVRFLMRGDLAAVRARGSVILRERGGVLELRPALAFGSPGEIGKVDLAIVALKTTSSDAAAGLVGPLLGPGTVILTLQNGLGADEFLAGLFGAERVAGGLVFMACMRTGPGEVTGFSPPVISVGKFGGPPEGRVLGIAAQLRASGMAITVVDNLLEARWRKLVWNIPFNGLTVAEGVTTDRICSDPALAGEARALMREIQRAARAFGFAHPQAQTDWHAGIAGGLRVGLFENRLSAVGYELTKVDQDTEDNCSKSSGAVKAGGASPAHRRTYEAIRAS